MTTQSDLDTYFHMRNHYRKLRKVKSTIDNSVPKSFNFVPTSARCKVSEKNQNFKSPLSRKYEKNIRKSTTNRKRQGHSSAPNGGSKTFIDNSEIKPCSKSAPVTSRPYDPGEEAACTKNQEVCAKQKLKSFQLDTRGGKEEGSSTSRSENICKVKPKKSSESLEVVEETNSSNIESNTEFEYIQFLSRIIEDIISHEACTAKDMKNIFSSHIEANRDILEMDYMLCEIERFCKSIEIPLNELIIERKYLEIINRKGRQSKVAKKSIVSPRVLLENCECTNKRELRTKRHSWTDENLNMSWENNSTNSINIRQRKNKLQLQQTIPKSSVISYESFTTNTKENGCACSGDISGESKSPVLPSRPKTKIDKTLELLEKSMKNLCCSTDQSNEDIVQLNENREDNKKKSKKPDLPTRGATFIAKNTIDKTLESLDKSIKNFFTNTDQSATITDIDKRLIIKACDSGCDLGSDTENPPKTNNTTVYNSILTDSGCQCDFKEPIKPFNSSSRKILDMPISIPETFNPENDKNLEGSMDLSLRDSSLEREVILTISTSSASKIIEPSEEDLTNVSKTVFNTEVATLNTENLPQVTTENINNTANIEVRSERKSSISKPKESQSTSTCKDGCFNIFESKDQVPKIKIKDCIDDEYVLVDFPMYLPKEIVEEEVQVNKMLDNLENCKKTEQSCCAQTKRRNRSKLLTDEYDLTPEKGEKSESKEFFITDIYDNEAKVNIEEIGKKMEVTGETETEEIETADTESSSIVTLSKTPVPNDTDSEKNSLIKEAKQFTDLKSVESEPPEPVAEMKPIVKKPESVKEKKNTKLSVKSLNINEHDFSSKQDHPNDYLSINESEESLFTRNRCCGLLKKKHRESKFQSMHHVNTM